MSRADDIRKRIAKRKRERERMTKHVNEQFFVVEEEEKYGFEKFPSYESDPGESGHPLFNKEFFCLKYWLRLVLCSLSPLFSAVAENHCSQ